MTAMHRIGLFVAIVGASGCAGAVSPPELVSARASYEQASRGPAAALNPTDLHAAKASLDAAEASFAEDGDTQITRDLGYTAERRAQTAAARARTMQWHADTERVTAQMHAGTAARGKESAAELTTANRQLALQSQSLQLQGVALETETRERKAAEERARQAASDLAKIASVTQEQRGLVISLSGSVLFASGKSDLLPAAKLRLNEVAKALSGQDPESTMVVEGHTDSQGMVDANQALSRARADAVRDYLVSRGVASDRITAEGVGSSRPLAENSTTEGRGTNRRVEIVVKAKR